jgi:phosphocarrier protein HPr
MIMQAVIICNKLGLHARAATRLVSSASEFECEVWIGKGERIVNGKSIMGVLTLAACKGTELSIKTDGSDEITAMDTIIKLINDRFGEAE